MRLPVEECPPFRFSHLDRLSHGEENVVVSLQPLWRVGVDPHADTLAASGIDAVGGSVRGSKVQRFPTGSWCSRRSRRRTS